MIILTGFGMSGVVIAPTAHAACTSNFLGFPAWYDGLLDGDCNIKQPGSGQNGLSDFIFTIVLNVIEIGLMLVGYAAVGYIIYGGFKYLTSGGTPDRITSGRKIILNAVIGLAISILSIGIVNLIASNLK
jgi:hypothetical protein